MPVPATIADLSTTEGSNYPTGSESIGTNLDNYMRGIQVVVKRLATGADAFTLVNAAVGSVGAPSIYLTGYATTGWYNIGANNWGFSVSGSKVLDIASTGLSVTGTLSATTGAAVGGATAGTGGIAFPATAVAVADVNTLDDYEEGTWTPAITFGGGSTGITYADQSGSYTKIGNRVTINAYVTLSNKGSSTGQALLTGMPFATASGFPGHTAVSLRVEGITFADFPMAYTSSNSTSIILEECTNAGTRSLLDNTDFSNTSSLMVSCTYKT